MRSRWKGSPHCEQTGRSGREAGGSNKSRVGPSRIADRSDPTSPNEREMETRGIGGKILLLGTLSLSSFCSITTSESATTTTCPAVHTMASRIKSVSQQSPAALMGEGGREVKGSPRPRLFLFLIRNRFSCLVLVGFPLSTFVCVCPVVVTSSSAFEERGDVQTTKEKGLSLFPGVDWKDARRSVRPSRPGAYYTMEADGGGVSSSCVNNRYDGIAAATPNGRQLSIVVRRRWMKSCGRKEKLRRGGLPWRNGRLSLSLFYLIHSLLCPNSFCLFQVRTLAVLGLTGKRERDSWLLLAHSRQHAVVRNELSRRRRRWEEENIPSLIGIRRQWRPSWTRHRRPMQIYIRVAPSRNYWNI